MGNLKCGSVDLNDPNVVKAITNAVQTELNKAGSYFRKNRDRPRLISPNMVLQPKPVSLSLNRLG